MTIIKDRLLTIPGGVPVPAATPVEIRLRADASLLDTVVTDANGFFTKTFNNGNPGPVEYSSTIGATTKKHSTETIMPVAEVDLSTMRYLLSAWNPGVIYRYPGNNSGGGLQVTANGTNMLLTVATGAAVTNGITHAQRATIQFTVPAATSSRTDCINLRFTYSGASAGKTEMYYSPNTTYYEQDLSQTLGYTDIQLARITVDNGVTSIATNKVTDTRIYASPQIGDGYILEHMLASGLGYPQVTTINEINTLNFGGVVVADATENLLVSNTIALATGSWSGLLHYFANFQIRHAASEPNLIGQAGATIVTAGLAIDGLTFALGSSKPILVVIPLTNVSGSLSLSLKAKFDFAQASGNEVSGARIYGTLTRTA